MLNELKIFLASPGDLAEERKIAKKVVDRINNILNKEIDWYLNLYGWEDKLTGAGRTKEDINKDVDV